MKTIFLATILIALTFVSEASALSRLMCYRAVHSACGAVNPHGRGLKTCLNNHSTSLTRSCGGKFPHIVAVAGRCEADARRFCGHVSRASAIPSCMERRLHEVGQPCRNALAKVGL
ncbi:MAG TPA: hypothetical protein VMU18_09705 [Rhodoblastus sp.]|nr:hypothetical protein [Rhodoblastus sp.]